MENKKADIDIRFLLELIIIILFVAAVVVFLVMKFQPNVANYVTNNIVAPLKGGS